MRSALSFPHRGASSLALVLIVWLAAGPLCSLLPAQPLPPAEEAEPVLPLPLDPSLPLLDPERVRTAPMTPAAIASEIPDHYLAQVDLDAEVKSDRVDLVATIEVVINRGDDWQRIPLRLGQAHIWKREYSGPGEEAPEIGTIQGEDGLTWLLKGVGKHQLKLYGWTPLRRTVTGGQLYLSLPPLPPQFQTRLRLRIPESGALVRSSKTLNILDVTRDADSTSVDASVVGNRLDFSWQTSVAGTEAISMVHSRIHLTSSSEHLRMRVDQGIELQQTSVEQVLVRLPTEFRMIQVSGSRYRTHEIVPDRPGWVRVHLTGETVGRIDLHWEFEGELGMTGRTIQVNGLQVEGAAREDGEILVYEFENFRMLPLQDESELVHRIGVHQVRSIATAGTPLTAYEFLNQPFQLAFKLEPVPPYFSVDPQYVLRFREQDVELAVDCPLLFDRGSTPFVNLDWSQWEDQGWRLVSAMSRHPDGRLTSLEVVPQADSLRLTGPTPFNENVSLLTVFRKTLSPGDQSGFTLTLPSPRSSWTGEGVLQVEAADELEVQLTRARGGGLAPVANSASEQPLSSGQSPQYRVPRFPEPLEARIVAHERQIRATATVEIQNATAAQLEIEQIIHLDVEYGRMTSLDLIPPELDVPLYALPESVDVWLEDRRLPLVYQADVLRAIFPSPRKGSFDVRIAYRYPIEGDEEIHQVDLPVIAVDGLPYSRGQCLIEAIDTVQVRSNAIAWEPVKTSPRGALWINPLVEGTFQHIPLVVGRRLADVTQQYIVERMELRTRFIQDGTVESWAEFHLDRRPHRIVIQFPPSSQFREFQVDGVALQEEPQVHQTDEHDEVTLLLPDQGEPTPRIGVRYRSPPQSAFGLTQRLTMPFPQFPRSVWIEETIWEMQLPPGHHLFTYPDMAPQFHWVRPFLVWKRAATDEYLQARTARDSSRIPDAFRFQRDDFYVFRDFGPVQGVMFRSMNRSLIVLIGAGFTLLLGFLFWKFPATRNVFSLVVIAFLFSALSLWYLEPMLLLLQPAALGLVLAFTATVIDSSARRRIPEPPVTSRSDHGGRIFREGSSSSPAMSTRIYQPLPTGKSDSIES